MVKIQNRGFTIVELLIVIVVIAILAAVSIVSYNGIQARANNTQTIAALKDYVEAYYLYALDNGRYPNVGPYACLGEGYLSQICASQGTVQCFGAGGVWEARPAAHNEALKPYMNNQVPRPSMQKIPCGDTTYVGGFARYSSVSDTVALDVFLRGNQICPSMSPNVTSQSKTYEGDGTMCRYNLAPGNSV